ncbi:MAG TPA: hypothetical protein VGA37_06415 [Gemmatimonadales bacterium]
MMLAKVTHGFPQIRFVDAEENLGSGRRGVPIPRAKNKATSPSAVVGPSDDKANRYLISPEPHGRQLMDDRFTRIWLAVPNLLRGHHNLREFAQI